MSISKLFLLALTLIIPSVSHSIVFNFSGTAGGVPPFLSDTSAIGSIKLTDTAVPGSYFDGNLGNVLSANLSIGGYDLIPVEVLGRVSNDGSTFSSLYATFESSINVNSVPYEVQFGFTGSPPTGFGNSYNRDTNESFTGGFLTGTWTTPPVTFNFSGTASGVPPFFSDTSAIGSIQLTGASALPGANFESSLGNVLHANFKVGGYDLPVVYPLSGTISNDGSTFSYLRALFEQEGGIIVDYVNYGVQVGFSPNLPTGRIIDSYNWKTNESVTGVLNGTWTVPEPSTFALMSLGLAGIGFSKRRSLT